MRDYQTQMVTNFNSSFSSASGNLQTLDDNVFGSMTAEVKLHTTMTIPNLANATVEWNIIK